mgnify:CR=1 FL=1
MNDKLVSVVIPVFNQESFVVECIASVLEQDYSNIQIIVIDDGSSDASAELAAKKFGNRIELLRQRNLGPSAAINAGLQIASGDFIALLGGDDISAIDRISRQVEFISTSRHDIVFSKPVIIDGEGQQLPDASFPIFFQESGDSAYLLQKLFFVGNFFCAPSAMLRKEVIQRIGQFHRGLIQLQDYDYWLRALAGGLSLGLDNHRGVYYRRHRENLSTELRSNAAMSEMPYILHRILNQGDCRLLRQAFQHVLKPVSLDTPLSEIEKNFLLMAHPSPEVRGSAVTHFLNHVESDVSFKEAEKYGFNQFRYLYNCGHSSD